MKWTPVLLRKIARLDHAPHVLTLAHDCFRHEEMEIFILGPRLAEAADVLRAVTDLFAGETPSLPPAIATRLQPHGLADELAGHSGRYVHHYPFFFRRVLPEDTLISMAGGVSEPLYSISVFTYLPPDKREPYYAFCRVLARCMSGMFGARLHWGKHFPSSAADVAPLYPDLDRFRELCRATDPHGVFRNDYTRRVLDL